MAYQPFLSKNIIINRDDRGPIPALEIPGDCDIIRILPTIDNIIYITENVEVTRKFMDKNGVKILRDKVEYFNVMNDNDKIFHIIIEKNGEWDKGSINITFMKDISFTKMMKRLRACRTLEVTTYGH